MTGKQRMWAAMNGDPVDRVPIWVREGFDVHKPLPPADDYFLSWRREADYEELWHFMRPYCDIKVGWSAGAHFNRFLGIPPHRMRSEKKVLDDNRYQIHTTIDTPKGNLLAVSEFRRGHQMMGWPIKPPVADLADLEKLRSMPYEVDPVSYDGYDRALEEAGDRGVVATGASSPWVCFSTCTSFEQALEWSLSENTMVHEILEGITEHFLNCLEEIFSRSFEPMMIGGMGGSEQCTPPMMSPDGFDEFVTPYDSRIVKFFNDRGIPVNCHCHGRVSSALESMLRIGLSSTDPVEPPPQGDVTMQQARDIAGDRLTLLGNLEWVELVEESPDHIRRRVKEIIDTGKRRLILSSSAGPNSRMSPGLIANYRAWIEAALEYGA